MDVLLFPRRIDPNRGWFGGRFRCLSDEPLGVQVEHPVQCALAGGLNGFSLAVVDLIRCHQAETGMVVVLIIPGEEAAAEVLGILDAAEAFGEFRLVFQGLEVGLRERVVVGGVGPAVRGDA